MKKTGQLAPAVPREVTHPASVPRESAPVPDSHFLRRTRSGLSQHKTTVLVYGLLVILIAYASAASPNFWTPSNFRSLLQQSIPLGLVALGQLVVVIAGGVDMSIGMIARLSALLTGVYLEAGTAPVVVGLLIGVAVGVGVGVCNGAIVTMTGANPFIVTLGAFGVLEGICLAVTAGSTGLMPPGFRQIYTASISGIPLSIIAMIGVWLLMAVFLRFTALGRHFYAVGGSAPIANLAGIRVWRVRLGAYVISGVFGALAGLFLLAQSGVANNVIGTNLEFASIVAVTLGGASLFGGRGTIVGTIGAVLLLTTILDVFQVLNVDTNYQNVFQGAVILCAIAVYSRKGSLRGGAA